MIKYLYTTAIIFCCIWQAKAQDIHFSQYDNAPLNMNAAHTGMFDGEYRIMANYRSQWFDVPVAYRTASIAFDASIMPRELKGDRWGIGLTFNHDQAGDSKMSLLNLYLSTAYNKRIAKNFFVGAGIQLGYANRRFQLSELTFNDQYNGDVFDPNIQSFDQSKFADKNNISYLDINGGINFRYERDKRTWMNFGLSLFHLNRPNQSFTGIDALLPRRTNLLFNGSFAIVERFDILPTLWWQKQQDYQELVFGATMKYYLNSAVLSRSAIQFGLLYRWSDALIVRLGYEYKQFQVALSYDINVSGFTAATRGNGGYELSLRYIWGTVPTRIEVRTCPVF